MHGGKNLNFFEFLFSSSGVSFTVNSIQLQEGQHRNNATDWCIVLLEESSD